FRSAVETPQARTARRELDAKDQLIARAHRAFETRLLDAREIEHRAVLLLADELEHEQAAGLRERFDDQHARHYRKIRKVPREERLVDRHVLQRDERARHRDLEHSVDEQEWIAMRQPLRDRGDIE